jgi:ankyrin repeat protein
MLQQGWDVNAADYDSRTGLMLAASHGHEQIVRQLLQAGASVNLMDKLGSTALLEAAKAGHDEIIA